MQTTSVERVSSSLAIQGSLAVVSALAGGPLAALLPVLATTLASKRQSERVTKALAEIQTVLHSLTQNIDALSDPQYKLLNETVLALLHTADDNKLAILKRAARNSLDMHELTDFEATALSRLLRDISAEECNYLASVFAQDRIALVVQHTKGSDRPTELLMSSKEGQLASGLVSLGILAAAGGTYDDLGTFRFMPLAGKLLAVVR